MKKHLAILCSLILVLSLTACGTVTDCSEAVFNGSRTGNDKRFLMDYTIFDKTDSQDLIANKGDVIHAKFNIEGGSLSFKLQKDNEAPVYEGADISSSDEFNNAVEESGTYTFSVTGKKAKGSISVTVVTPKL